MCWRFTATLSRACDQGRAVGDGNRDEQQLARAALEVSNAHGNIREDHQRDDKRQELAEERRERYHKAAEAFRQELAEQDADNDGDDDKLGEDTTFHVSADGGSGRYLFRMDAPSYSNPGEYSFESVADPSRGACSFWQ